MHLVFSDPTILNLCIVKNDKLSLVGALARNQIMYASFRLCCMCNFLFLVRVYGLLYIICGVPGFSQTAMR